MKSRSPIEYWKTVRALNPSNDEGMELEENGVKTTDEKEKGNIINPFFKKKVRGLKENFLTKTSHLLKNWKKVYRGKICPLALGPSQRFKLKRQSKV